MCCFHASGELRGANAQLLAERFNFQQPLRDSTQLTKLQAALCESMRYKPVGPVSIRRATAAVSISHTDKHTMQERQLLLQPGDTVIISMAAMHNDSATFPNPRSFDLRNITSRPLPEGSFLPFGHGRKGCVVRGTLELR
jgi:cytochrome P450